MWRLLSNRIVQVFFLVSIYFCVARFLPVQGHQFLYTLSLSIKDLLIWMMPLTVCFFIANTLRSFENKVPIFIISIMLFEFFSNFICVWYGFVCGNFAVSFLPPLGSLAVCEGMEPLWRLSLSKPFWWSANQGIFCGALLGCLCAFFKKSPLNKVIVRGKNLMEIILTKVFARLIPIFILGFVANLYQGDLLRQMVKNYWILILFTIVFLSLYLFFLLFWGARGSIRRLKQNARSLLPACGVAMTTGCSLSTMPWTINGAMKTLMQPELARAIIPSTTNIQQIGDCIANTFLSFLIYYQFNGQAPDLCLWLPFSIVYALQRFATAAVLGGAIFIMVPVYEHYLSFSPEMVAIILAFNVFLDPIITGCNVLGNGSLCCIFERLWIYIQKSLKRGRSYTKISAPS